MITSLSTEDNIEITNSLQQFSLILSNNIKKIVNNLNEILKYDNADIFIYEITECTKTISEFNLKYEQLEKPLEKIKLIQDFRNNLKNFIIKRQEYTTDEVVGELIKESLVNLKTLEKTLKEAEPLQITVAYLEAIKKPVDDKLSWLQNLYSSMFYMLEILEDGNVALIPKNILKTIETTSEALSSNKALRDYIKTSKNDENEEKIRNYINSIRQAAKATLWELKKLKEEQPNIQSLLKFIQSSPEWKGDDFEECLDFINEERRK
ncbi:hypothetical protein A6770_38015 [Nostoc minutum NIES-26]|uniref:Uncharacterized protein n=1 Tax=Nostoc minutum NIES-26 TaxID=1844469 RepID=A0A367RVZ8_9NOSO|nr:hypothetical protein A6770_38015 [Nostoc minutum NIES-26]